MIASVSRNPKDPNKYPESDQGPIFLKQLIRNLLFYYGPDLSLQSKFNLTTSLQNYLDLLALKVQPLYHWNELTANQSELPAV